jgi:hypothetical protein
MFCVDDPKIRGSWGPHLDNILFLDINGYLIACHSPYFLCYTHLFFDGH